MAKKLVDGRKPGSGTNKGTGPKPKPWANSILVGPKRDRDKLKTLDTYENARLIALSIAVDETKHVQQRLSAIKFLYPEEKPELGAIAAKTIVFRQVENSDVTDSTDHETETT